MKKAISLVITLCMMLSLLAVSACAEKSDTGFPAVLDYPKVGFHFESPESFRNAKGTLDMGAVFLADNILQTEVIYYGVAPEQFEEYCNFGEAYVNALLQDEELPEAPDPNWVSGHEFAYLFFLFSVGDGLGEAELLEALTDSGNWAADDFSSLEEIGKDGDTTFFVGQLAQLEEEDAEFREGMGRFYDEFSRLAQDKETFLSALTLSTPKWPVEVNLGDTVSFETTDLDGNVVTSDEIFAQAKVTMINLWATWCGPCKGELPELGEMAKEFEAQGCQIIGIVIDGAEEGKADIAKSLLADAGAEYLNVAAPENLDDVIPTTSFPTTFFVDSEGHLLADPILGAAVDQYPETLAEVLAALG